MLLINKGAICQTKAREQARLRKWQEKQKRKEKEGMALIERGAAYKALMHEDEEHMLPEYKEAYERAAGIISQMRSYSDDERGQCVYRGQEEGGKEE